MRITVTRFLKICLLVLPTSALAADYVIDTKGAHAFIQFHIKHLGYSWLVGRFNTFAGEFSYDEANPEAAKVSVTIDTASIDSNHAERDKHLRDEEFLNVEKYPQAKFVSTTYPELSDGKGELQGDFTLNGVTRPMTIEVSQIGLETIRGAAIGEASRAGQALRSPISASSAALGRRHARSISG